MSNTPSAVSFTIRRPDTSSRSSSDGDFKVPHLPKHLQPESRSIPGSPLGSAAPSPKRSYQQYAGDSDDSGEENFADELVTGFDQFGVQRLHEKNKATGPLVIAPQQNRDWREVAKKRKNAGRYVPASAKATTGADGSVGGLGTRDSINSGPVNVGLHLRKKVKVELDNSDAFVKYEPRDEDIPMKETAPESEDARALRLLLADDEDNQGSQLDAIPSLSETDAYKQDVDELPDAATLEDYARVPVAQFGAALLRGMGWKDPAQAGGKAQGRNGKKDAELWLPTSRPALLGLGAKEREVLDDGSKPKPGHASKRPDKRYVPIIRQEKEGGTGTSGRGTPAARSRSPSSRGSISRRHSPSRDDRRRDDDKSSRRRDDDRDSSRRRDDDRDSHRKDDRDSSRRRDDRDRDSRRKDGRDPRRDSDRHRDDGKDSKRRDERSSSSRREY